MRFSVRDTGIGIRNEDLPLLFGNFSQVDTRKNRGIEGSGLGLAISKKLVELMDGGIQVESTYGEGSCFSFYILQRIENSTPAVVLPDKPRRVAVRLANAEKARNLSQKLASLGVCHVLANAADGLEHFTHVFFDGDDYAAVHGKTSPSASLIALMRSPTGESGMPPSVQTVYTPLTSLTVAKLLDTETRADDAVSDAASTLRVSEARILVVDDNEINLMIAENLLLAYGGEVDTAASGARAVELVKTGDYDIVFMDHMMPGMDGVDTTRLIRSLPGEKYASLPIVALTANVVGDVRNMFLQNGMNDFLAKPIGTRELELILQKWLPSGAWTLCESRAAQPAESPA
jgi:CheY-like chemotaxis protein